MNKELKFTIPAGGSQVFTYPTGVDQIAITNHNGNDGESGESIPVSKTIENAAIAHFTDAASAPLLDLAVGVFAEQAGSGVPSPENERTLTGFSEVNITRVGKNFFKSITGTQYGVTITQNADGSLTLNGTATQSYNFQSTIAVKRGTYTFSARYQGTLPDSQTTIRAQLINTTYGVALGIANGEPADTARRLVLSNDMILTCRIRIDNRFNYNNVILYPQLELGESLTDFAPYSSNTYESTMPASEGYVFGALLDVLTGKLTVVYRLSTYTGAEGEPWDYTDGVFKIPKHVDSTPAVYACNFLQPSETSEYNNTISCDSTNLVINTDVATSLEDWKTYLAAHNLQVLYRLATPVEYYLQPTEIYALLGENNLFANSGDIVKVRYLTSKYEPIVEYVEEKTAAHFQAVEDFSTNTISLTGATSTDIKNYLLTHKNADVVIHVKEYSTIELYHLIEYSPNYFASFATHAAVYDVEGTKTMRINYLRLDLTQETSDFTDDYIILQAT